MDQIARRVQQTRDATFVDSIAEKPVRHTLGIASLGGATMNNEWNYVQAKLMRAMGVVFIENQARI
jgi:formate dehydrogenase major subunit